MITRRDFFKFTAAGSALAAMSNVQEAKAVINKILPDSGFCYESERKIPIYSETDIVVVGGNSRAVAAAVAAAKQGCKVFLIAPLTYLGDDICGSFMYDLKEGEKPQTALARKIFEGEKTFRPLYCKTVLENELIDNGVYFLYSSYITELLVDSSGNISGVVMVSRSGRQAIKCKSIIDATQEANIAKLAGLKRSRTDMPVDYVFTAVGNNLKSGDSEIKVESVPVPVVSNGKEYSVIRYICKSSRKIESYADLMDIEHKLRDYAWDPDQVDSSDIIWYIPNEQLECKVSYNGDISSLRKYPIDSFQPNGVNNLWIIGPCADISREAAEYSMRPVNALWLAELLGEQIGNRTKAFSLPANVEVQSNNSVKSIDMGYIGEVLKPVRPFLQKEYVYSKSSSLPILGEYDVVVLGGGTAGASAGISSAKQGVKTLVLEYLHGLGGLGTLGLIGCYWDGYREGFTSYIDESVHNMAPEEHPRQEKDWRHRSVSDWKMEWYRRELHKYGGKLWFGVLGCGALVKNNIVKGVVIATPFGRGVILSKVLIDSTGSADIAISAGAEYEYTGIKTLAIQGAGAGKRNLGDSYNNNDWLFIDDSDVLDVSRTFVQAKHKMAGNYDIVKIPQTRERRRVIGEHVVSVYDVLNHRRYSDTISFHQSSFDTHGMIVDPYFILSPPMKRHVIYNADVPLRSLLPKGLDGILTTGLGASASRDAMPVIRMQPCLQNQGYAVGYLSARCVKEGKTLRKIDIKKIQKHLVSIANLPERVLKDKDFKGFGKSEMNRAVETVTDNYKGLEILLTDPIQCKSFLLKRISKENNVEAKTILASILCMLGDDSVSNVLVEAIKSYDKWDEGWHYTGMHQFGMSLSRLDALIMSLGKSGNKGSLNVITDKARILNPEDCFSHFRAISMAYENIGSRDAIPQLSEMLSKPGVVGHSISNYNQARISVVPDDIDVSTRNLSLKELHLARALYLCGDKDNIGRTVLEKYASGLEGHYARYAFEVLQSK
ncbi:MAG: FAD-dependent oxidoreductase [Parabacteroides sp.]|nr:FAD-dependent oxidoreductase [Parabacteroides sp.]